MNFGLDKGGHFKLRCRLSLRISTAQIFEEVRVISGNRLLAIESPPLLLVALLFLPCKLTVGLVN